MRASILSLLLITSFLAGCSGGPGTGKPETLTLREKKVTFTGPPPTWKRKEIKSDPTADASFKEQTMAVQFFPPASSEASPSANEEGNGFLLVTNLGVSDVRDRARELHAIVDLLKKEGASQEVYNRIIRQLDESGSAGLLEYVDENGKISSVKSNQLHEELEKAANLLNVPTGSQPKVKEAIPHLEKAAQLCDEGWKKKEVDLIETGRVWNAVDKRGGKLLEKKEIQVDGQRAAWMEYEVGDERGIHVLFMKDNNLFSIALSVPGQGFSEGKKVTERVVESFKVQ